LFEYIQITDIELGLWGVGYDVNTFEETTLSDAGEYNFIDEDGIFRMIVSTTFKDYAYGKYKMIMEFTRPHLYLNKLLTSIFTKLGVYKNIVNPQLNNEIDKIVMPQIVSKNNTKYEGKFKIINKKSHSYVARTTSAGTPQTTLFTEYFGSYCKQGKTEFAAVNELFTDGSFYIPEDGFYNLKFKISYVQNNVGNNTVFPIPAGFISKIIRQSNGAHIYFHKKLKSDFSTITQKGYNKRTDGDGVSLFEAQPAVEFTINQTNVTNYEKIFDLLKLEKGFYSFSMAGTEIPQPTGATLWSDTYFYEFDNINVDIEVIPIKEGSIQIDSKGIYLDGRFLFGYLNIKDVLKAIFQTFGLYMQFKDGFMELYTPLDLKNNILNSKDWSKKVVSVTKNDYKTLKFGDIKNGIYFDTSKHRCVGNRN